MAPGSLPKLKSRGESFLFAPERGSQSREHLALGLVNHILNCNGFEATIELGVACFYGQRTNIFVQYLSGLHLVTLGSTASVLSF